MYKIGDNLKLKRVGDARIELEINGKKSTVLTEDLAAVLSQELPNDRAQAMFAEIEETAIKKGKARVMVQAEKNIKKGETVCFSIDITKYADGSGIRTTDNGIIF